MRDEPSDAEQPSAGGSVAAALASWSPPPPGSSHILDIHPSSAVTTSPESVTARNASATVVAVAEPTSGAS